MKQIFQFNETKLTRTSISQKAKWHIYVGVCDGNGIVCRNFTIIFRLCVYYVFLVLAILLKKRV